MKVVITGGFGFIGGRLAQHLAQVGHHVVLGSRRFCKEPPEWLSGGETFHIDWESDHSFEEMVANTDVIVHTAGMNAQACESSPVAAVEFNGLVTARLVSAAEKQGVKEFIYLSTAHVYSAPLKGVITEESRTSNIHPYATSHRAGEDAVLWANRRGKIKGIVFRVSNAVGMPVEKDVNCWMLITNDLCREVVTKKRLTIRSEGTQSRDFIAISAVAKTIEFFINNITSTPFSIYNLGGGKSYTVNEIAKIVQDRYLEKYSIYPYISRFEHNMEEGAENLEYKVDRLKETGVKIKNNIAQEIDDLLIFCDQNFLPDSTS